MVRRRSVAVLVGMLVAAGCASGDDGDGGGIEPVAETLAVLPTAVEPVAAAETAVDQPRTAEPEAEPAIVESTGAEPTATEPVAETAVATTMAEAGSLTSPVDESVDRSVPPDGTEVCPLTRGDLEGCFDYDGMQAFYDEGIAAVFAYIEATFTDPAVMQPAQWIFVEEGATGQEPCTDESGGFATYTDESYEYCPLDETVYVGQRELWNTYEQAGDAGAVIGMAHEAGHHMQAVAGVGGAGTARCGLPWRTRRTASPATSRVGSTARVCSTTQTTSRTSTS